MLTIRELIDIAAALLQKVPEFATGAPALHIGEPIMYFDTLIIKDGKYRLMRSDPDSRGGPEILELRSTDNPEEAIYWALYTTIEDYLFHRFLSSIDYRYRSYQPLQYAERKRIFDIMGAPYAQMDEKVLAEQIAKYPPLSDLTYCISDLEEDYNRIAMQLHNLSPKGKDYTPECKQHIHNLRFRKFRCSFRKRSWTTSQIAEGFIKMRHAANEISRILLEAPNTSEEMKKCAEEFARLEEIAKTADDEISRGNFD